MRDLTWFQADFIARNFNRPVRRIGWHRWIAYSATTYLYFSRLPELDPSLFGPTVNPYHVTYCIEHEIEEWFANDWTDEDWDAAVPVLPPVEIPPIPPPFGTAPGGGPGVGTPGTPGRPGSSGGGTGGTSGGTSGGGTTSGGSAAYPSRDPFPETPPAPADPVVVSLTIDYNPSADTSHPIYYTFPGPPAGHLVPPAGHFSTSPDDVIGATVSCWTDLGYPTTEELIGTVTVTGGRAGTANGSIRNVDGSIYLFTMGVPGSHSFSTVPQPYGTRSYFARVGMPGEHPLDLAHDVASGWVEVTAAPKCSDIGF